MSMEKAEHRRRQPAAAAIDGALPRMQRSKSGGAFAMSSLPMPNLASKSSKAPGSGEIPRPKERKMTKKQEAADGGGGGFIRFLPRAAIKNKNKMEVPRRTRSASTSPSAWALSPGRSLPCAPPAVIQKKMVPDAKSPAKPEGGGGGVSGVVRTYLRQTKASRLDEEYHPFRVAYNRLLQWRFTNARAEAATAAANRLAQKKVYLAWARISLIQKSILEQRQQLSKLKQCIKVDQILNSEMVLLNQWWRMEPRNMEAVGRLVRKLSALSTCIPLVHNTKGDVISVSDAVAAATGVMEEIKQRILGPYEKVEKICFLLTELSVMVTQYEHVLEDLEKSVTLVAALQVQEESLMVQQIYLKRGRE